MSGGPELKIVLWRGGAGEAHFEQPFLRTFSTWKCFLKRSGLVAVSSVPLSTGTFEKAEKPCWDALLCAGLPQSTIRAEHPPTKHPPPPPPKGAATAAPGPRAAWGQQPAALGCWQERWVHCRQEQPQGSHCFRCGSGGDTQEHPSTSGLLTPHSRPGVTCKDGSPCGNKLGGFTAPWRGGAGGAGEWHSGAAKSPKPPVWELGCGLQAQREGRGVRAEVFSAQSRLLMCELVLALGRQQIPLCRYLLPCRNVHQL